jgi:YjbE family integral membrane protein
LVAPNPGRRIETETAMDFDVQTGLALIEIVWINLLLSGDNAVVIALACRGLPPAQRKWGVILGTAPAVVLRILFSLFIVYLMEVPYLKLVGGLLLFWIAVKLLQPEQQAHGRGSSGSTLWAAARTIILADVVMSLDNVIALAAAAHGKVPLLILGLAISMPLVIVGSTLLLRLLTRFPLFVTLGGALLGYIAGETIAGDLALRDWFGHDGALPHRLLPVAAAAAALALGRGLTYVAEIRRRKRVDLTSER